MKNSKLIKILNNEQQNDFYIISETAYNHQGDLNYLYKMVDEISELKIDAVKFHLLLNPESYMQKRHPLMRETKKWIFNKKQWDEIINYSNKKKLEVIALCDDVESIEHINKSNKDVAAIELHATGLNDWLLLRESAKFKGPVILGIGGSAIDEMAYAIDFLKKSGKNEILLMYGFQSYPTRPRDTNLSKMLKLKDLFELPIGYADHTAYDNPNNEIISCMPAMMGFNILEKHYTPDYGKERIDYQAAIGEKQMLRIKELMKLALTVYGEGSIKMSEAELKYGVTGPMKKAIVAKKFIKKGEKLSLNNLWFKRTKDESPIRQYQFLSLLGLKAIQDIKQDEIIDFSKVKYYSKK